MIEFSRLDDCSFLRFYYFHFVLVFQLQVVQLLLKLILTVDGILKILIEVIYMAFYNI